MLDRGSDYANEDVGNIVALEHVNVRVPDQTTATLFYIVGMGFTRDPYMSVGIDNMWINAGKQQFHLPTGNAQVLPGHIGVVVPDITALKRRLEGVQGKLAGTHFAWSVQEDRVEVTCPWGNQFWCFAPGPKSGDMSLGVPYVEFLVEPGASKGIGQFYEKSLGAAISFEQNPMGATARVDAGHNQTLVFQETAEERRPYDGHHIAVYLANFSGPYAYLRGQNLITEEVRNHQFRFQEIVHPDSHKPLLSLEHEVRSLRHPLYHRPLVNRDIA